MTVLEMLAHWRDLTKDYDLPAQVIVGKLLLAEPTVFHEVGGLANPDILAALQVDHGDTISAARQYLVIDGQEPSTVTAYVDSKVCAMYGPKDKAFLEQNYALRPAAVVEGSRITFYTEGRFISGTRNVRVSYVRVMRPILFLAGYTVVGGLAGFGQRGKAALLSFDFIWPDSRPVVSENELAGAILSVQHDDLLRYDYRIEENEAEMLRRVFVNPVYTAAEWPLPEPQGAATKGSQSIVHRTSDLPEKFHALVVQRAAGTLPVEVKK